MAAYGHARTTLDLDLVVEDNAQKTLIIFMESQGYETVYRSVGYSNHIHSDPNLGRVDFVYVAGETGQRLFSSAKSIRGPQGLLVLVPKAEHLAAMKVVAMKHDPTRVFHEMDDIRFLLNLPGVNREEIRGYFEKHGMGERFEELKRML